METEVMSSSSENPIVLDVPKRSLREYAREYDSLWNASRKAEGKATESVLKLCRVVFEASVVLDEKEFKTFREQHKELKSSSMVSQFKKVGANYERLAKYAESLPSSWYALYLLAGAADSLIEQAIENKTLHPLTTQRNVEALIDGDTNEQQTETEEQRQAECSFRIHILTQNAFDVTACQASLDAFLEEQKDAFGWNAVAVKGKAQKSA